MSGYWRTLLLTLLLAGCAAQPRPAPGEGLLVVSVTQETATPTHAFSGETTEAARVYTAAFRLTGPDAHSRWLSAAGFKGTRIMPQAGKPLGSGGRLHVIPLPAGEYRIDYWEIFHNIYSFGPAALPPPLHFSIQPGETLYVGNLHMDISMGGALIDAYKVAASQAQVRDSQSRDLALLAKLQAPGAVETVVRLLPLGDWNAAEAPVTSGP